MGQSGRASHARGGRGWVWALAAASLLAAHPAAGQVRAGPEFQISGSGSADPAVATMPGGFVAAWRTASGDRSIAIRRFDAHGNPLGAEFVISPPQLEELFAPQVATLPNGDFIVVWTHFGIDPDSVYAQCFDGEGRPLSASFRVDPNGLGYVGTAAVAASGEGRYVVVWSSAGADGSGFGILGRTHDRDCTPLGSEFRVNGYTTNDQRGPDISLLSDGTFVMAWTTPVPGGLGPVARRFTADGSPLGPETAVGVGGRAAVAAGRDGAFAAVWAGFAFPVPDRVLGRWFGASGPIGPELRLDPVTQYDPLVDVAGNALGSAWAAWHASTNVQVFLRHFPQSGNVAPAPLVVDDDPGNRGRPAIASDGDGNLVLAWNRSSTQSIAIIGQRFGGVHAAGVAFDSAASGSSDGNGVLEAGETVDVRPAWRNVNGTTLSLAGSLSFQQAPFPYPREITDGVAEYGPVPDGATGACLDCYALRLEAFPSGRPPGHLDLPAVETLQPAELQLNHLWKLHVGDSFADVPRTSAFYKSVETTLHRGVAGGCASASFCPTAGVTREQMAVFVLKAKEWPAYAPRACTAPVFDDVPSSSPFCRWIEELVRRGVTAGCGASSYCPSAPVTRAQTAVFVLRALDPDLQPPACTTPMFADVPASDPFCRWIEELARRGVVAGCGGGNYCPNATTTREQMAAIVTAAFGLTLYGP